MLAVIEEVRLGHITNGFVPINDQMVEAFKREWRMTLRSACRESDQSDQSD